MIDPKLQIRPEEMHECNLFYRAAGCPEPPFKPKSAAGPIINYYGARFTEIDPEENRVNDDTMGPGKYIVGVKRKISLPPQTPGTYAKDYADSTDEWEVILSGITEISKVIDDVIAVVEADVTTAQNVKAKYKPKVMQIVDERDLA